LRAFSPAPRWPTREPAYGEAQLLVRLWAKYREQSFAGLVPTL
jgi:hypothetical protein